MGKLNTLDETFSLSDLEYDLPEHLIAQEPLSIRHESRLLTIDKSANSIKHNSFSDIVDILESGDCLVVNDTKVIPTRFIARRKSGGAIKVQLIKPVVPGKNHIWEAMAMPLKRLKAGEELDIECSDGKFKKAVVDDVTVGGDGFKRLIINLLDNQNMMQILKDSGHAPLPPYIKRDLAPSDLAKNKKRLADLERYQTVFATAPGAVAAPTAGLHFSKPILEKLKGKGIKLAKITLHVGAGTFKPITSSIDDHSIEEETFSISKETKELINGTKEEGRRVIAVGTTSVRALETAGASGSIKEVSDQATSLYVKPGFKFKIIDGMVTNFHLSGSSLLVLVATFAGKDITLNAYREAVDKEYRFFSYGDAMLIL